MKEWILFLAEQLYGWAFGRAMDSLVPEEIETEGKRYVLDVSKCMGCGACASRLDDVLYYSGISDGSAGGQVNEAVVSRMLAEAELMCPTKVVEEY